MYGGERQPPGHPHLDTRNGAPEAERKRAEAWYGTGGEV